MRTLRLSLRDVGRSRYPLPASNIVLVILLTLLCIAILTKLAGISLSIPADAAERQIRIGGSGGALGAVKLLAEEYNRANPNAVIVVFPSLGSSGGIKALLSGTLDIALSSRLLTEKERSLGAVEQEYARTPLVFATSTENRVSGFTLREIVDIYAGKTTNWPDGRPIRLVLRPSSEFDMSLLRSMSSDMDRAVQAALARKGMIVAITDQDSADAIEKIPGALGTSTLAQIISEKRALKVLSLDGIAPARGVIADRTYPHMRTFSVITKKNPTQHVQQFITFLFSSRGQEILTRSGNLATKR